MSWFMHIRSRTQPLLPGRCSLGLFMLTLFAVSGLFAPTAYADDGGGAHFVTVQMNNRLGEFVGTVQIRQLTGGTLFITHLRGLPPGKHPFRIRYEARCAAPSAGVNPGGGDEPGYYAGHVSNIQVSAQGTAVATIFAPQWVLGTASVVNRNAAAATGWLRGPFSLLDDDGSAIVIYDELASGGVQSPDGVGRPVACGVIAATDANDSWLAWAWWSGSKHASAAQAAVHVEG